MVNKPAYAISDQINLLKKRGMSFLDERLAHHYLANISYYRLKGYWWDMQTDYQQHIFLPNSLFKDVIDRYNFDRHLRLILFDAIERIEIALRTQMIYQMSVAYGGLWYLEPILFENKITDIKGIRQTLHLHTLHELKKKCRHNPTVNG